MDLDAFVQELVSYLRESVFLGRDSRCFSIENRFISSLWKGKFLRSKFIAAAFYSMRKQIGRNWKRYALKAAAGIEIIHLASLIHDDVIDGAEKRRGKICFHRRFSISEAIVWGDWLFARGVQEFEDIDAGIFGTMAISEICEGQLLEEKLCAFRNINWDNYFSIISKKTAALFQIGVEVLSSFIYPSDDVMRLSDYAFLWGISFQLYDDLLDIREDFSDKKITFPMVLLKRVDTSLARDMWDGKKELDAQALRWLRSLGKGIIGDILNSKRCPEAFSLFYEWMVEKLGRLN